MPERKQRTDVVRQDAEWMVPADDRILEIIREKGNLTPKAIVQFDVASRSHATRRCGELAKYGLLNRIAPGLYGITDDGRAYLNEELDASTLDPVDD